MEKKIQFIDEISDIQADLMIILDSAMRKKMDVKLNGAISLNRRLGHEWMTTNGLYSVPKLAIGDRLPPEVREQRVALVVDRESEKSAFDLLLSSPQIEELTIVCSDPKGVEKRFGRYSHLLAGIRLAKDLISAPANLMPPEEFASRCTQLKGVDVEIFDPQKIGATALSAVGQGSKNAPRLAVMHWRGGSGKPFVLVGKGICFDSGGIHLKSSFLNEMKWDKAGAGVVVGTMEAISRMKLPLNVIGIVALAENMPDGGALKPGDVISTLGGKSVEIVDTDCEGRLVLADGLAYAQKHFDPEVLIDLATLTLETFGALGSEYAGLFCPDIPLRSSLIEAGERANEKLWPLPLGEPFASHVHSEIADLKNVGIPRYGASSAAAEFLRAFVHPTIPWAHLDIAGVSWNLEAPEKGVTGFGVRLLTEFLTKASEAKATERDFIA